MNKKSVTACFCLIMMAGRLVAAGDPSFSLKGKIQGAKSGYIYLQYQGIDKKGILDSALIRKGAFRFEGQLAHPVMATLFMDRERAMYGEGTASFFIEPGELKIKLESGDFENPQLSGSKTHEEYLALKRMQAAELEKLKPLNAEHSKLKEAYIEASRQKKDSTTLAGYSEKLENLKEQMRPYSARMREAEDEFIAAHPDSYVSAYLLRYKIAMYSFEKASSIFNSWTKPLQQSSYGQEVSAELEKLKMGSPGSVAHLFARTDINGERFNLSDYKGGYVLLDFWASWCVPCRAGNPHLIELYKQYRNRGLEIVGISDDDSKPEAWRKAVEKDRIGIWKHVLRGFDVKKRMKGEANPDDLSEQYGIHSLPTKILIDKEGVIIGRYGGGGENDDALDAKLAALMPAKDAVSLKGHIKGLKDSVSIGWYDETGPQNENVAVQDEKFSWTKKLKEPQKIFIGTPTGYMELFVENADIMIEGSVDSFYQSKVTGSATQDEYIRHRASIEPLVTSLYAEQGSIYSAKGDREKAEIEARVDSISRLIDIEEEKYIRNNPASIVSLNLVQNKAIMGEYDEVNSLYQLLAPDVKELIAGKKLEERIGILKRSAPGTAFKDFTMPSLNGKPVRLSDFKGKYVFVDFWASWCGPCRAENPNVLKAYNKYRNDNFTVLGVSLDDKRDKWKAAVEKDKMPWTQISDLKGFENELSSYYGIMAIPATILIDPQGRIIEKGLRGARLHDRLAEILK